MKCPKCEHEFKIEELELEGVWATARLVVNPSNPKEFLVEWKLIDWEYAYCPNCGKELSLLSALINTSKLLVNAWGDRPSYLITR